MKNSDVKIITERIEEYFEEKIDDKKEREYNELTLRNIEEEERKRREGIQQFARIYLKENPQEICTKCHKRECTLLSYFYRCGYVGLEINHENYIIFNLQENKLKMEKTERHWGWDRYSTISDEELKTIDAIF